MKLNIFPPLTLASKVKTLTGECHVSLCKYFMCVYFCDLMWSFICNLLRVKLLDNRIKKRGARWVIEVLYDWWWLCTWGQSSLAWGESLFTVVGRELSG